MPSTPQKSVDASSTPPREPPTGSRWPSVCARTDPVSSSAEQFPETSGEGGSTQWLRMLEAVRPVAARASVDVRLRLQLARRWLDDEPQCDPRDARATHNDRCAFAWSAAAAVRGDREGQVLLGRCFARGRGIARSEAQARRWLRRAAAAGSSEAQYRLRALSIDRHRWLHHRYTVLGGLGLVLLVMHAVTHPLQVNALGILAYLGLSIATFPLHLAANTIGRRHDTGSMEAPEHDASSGSYVYARMVEAWLRRPWRILWVATEDGAILAPLLWIGVTPWSAALAGAVFGLAHYPSFSARACLVKAIEYMLVAMVLLPWAGLWSIVLGHVLWDVALLALGARHGRAGRASRPAMAGG